MLFWMPVTSISKHHRISLTLLFETAIKILFLHASFFFITRNSLLSNEKIFDISNSVNI